MNEDASEKYIDIFNTFYNTRKSATYKYVFLYSIVNSIESAYDNEKFCNDVWEGFTRFYWKIIVEYQLCNAPNNNINIEKLMRGYIGDSFNSFVEFDELDKNIQESLVSQTKCDCSKYVVERLNNDFGGIYCVDKTHKFKFFDLSSEFIDVVKTYKENIINNILVELAILYKRYNLQLSVIDIYNILCDICEKEKISTDERDAREVEMLMSRRREIGHNVEDEIILDDEILSNMDIFEMLKIIQGK